MTNPSVTIKSIFSTPKGTTEIRRFALNLSSPAPFTVLNEILFKSYGPAYNLDPALNKFLIRYHDPDADLCLISSDMELSEAIRLANEEKKVLKILINLEEEGAELLSIPQTPSSVASSNGLSINTNTSTNVNSIKVEESKQPLDDFIQVEDHRLEAKAATENNAVSLTAEAVSSPPAAPGAEITAPFVSSAPVIPEPATSPVEEQLETSVAVSEAALASTANIHIHAGVKCDVCGAAPIIGTRYKCLRCADFDMCEGCENAGNHAVNHFMLKIRTPLSFEAAEATVTNARTILGNRSRCPRSRAEFISDVTLADGIIVKGGETVRKVWSVRNSGISAWPAGTSLVFVGGDLNPSQGANNAAAEVPSAAPGHVVHIEIDIVVPEEAGRYRATFRLQSPSGHRFGPRIWLDITVKNEGKSEEKKYDKAAQDMNNNAAPAAAAAAAAIIAPPAAPKPVLDPEFKYAAQLQRLLDMGFSDIDLNKYLLNNNAGDEQKVVQWILANSPSQI
jgi:hypothetical protein